MYNRATPACGDLSRATYVGTGLKPVHAWPEYVSGRVLREV